MRRYSLTHLSDAVLLRDLAALVSKDRVTTADLLAHIAEVDARKLYVPAGHSSMHAYCVKELRLSEGAAFKRIRAARAARDFPELFQAVAEGRLHLAAVCLLAPCLTRENVGVLMRAATHRRKSEIEAYLAREFPLATLPKGKPTPGVTLRPIPTPRRRIEGGSLGDLLSPGTVEAGVVTTTGVALVGASAGEAGGTTIRVSEHGAPPAGLLSGSTGIGKAGTGSPETGEQDADPASLPPTGTSAPTERYLLKVVLDKETHDRLRYAQVLLSHAVPSGDVAQVLRRALEAMIPQLERRKFGALSGKRRPHPPARPSSAKRHIPAYIRRAVWARDQGRCTFQGTNGQRCHAVRLLEYDHVDPHVRTPDVSVEGLRLRCRAHNQYEAERIFGAEFMAKKRRESKRTAAAVNVRDPSPPDPVDNGDTHGSTPASTGP